MTTIEKRLNDILTESKIFKFPLDQINVSRDVLALLHDGLQEILDLHLKKLELSSSYTQLMIDSIIQDIFQHEGSSQKQI